MGSPESPPAASRPFKRSYIACNSCRARKARCIIKDSPPCSKCAREHRECQFDYRPRAPKQRELPKWIQRDTDHTTTSHTNPRPAGQPSLGSAVQVSPPAWEQFTRHQGPENATGTSATPPSTSSLSLYDRVRSTIVTGSNDALDILSDAARPDQGVQGPGLAQSRGTNIPIPIHDIFSTGTGPSVAPGGYSGLCFTITRLSEVDDATLDLWDKSRFVRQGWFTAQEAVTYIDLFFEMLAPLSPVKVDQFGPHSAHTRLVYEEAMLCCTLLMISSRFFMLPGAGGTTRSHSVHRRLWSHCEILIRRILLGQEKESTAKTRALGTIESLILISDWHPRALHLPPETDGWDGLLISPEYNPHNRRSANNDEPLIRWREDVFEPAKRVNRMSWMLLGMATDLGYELGLFSSQSQMGLDQNDDESRRLRAQSLLHVYVTQTSTRLNYPCVFPESVSMIASRLPTTDATTGEGKAWAAYMEMSQGLTQLSRTSLSMFFQSTAHLQNQVLGEHYADLLDHFSSPLASWQQKLDAYDEVISETLRDMLLIEFHHLKACTGAISIQAVVARAAAAGISATSPSSSDSLSSFVTTKDARFLQNVISDSRRTLQVATMTSFKSQLPFAPARVKIIVISASVFLLKALSVGYPYTDMVAALDDLDECTAVLKAYPPDDMDFALRYATLVEKHTAQFRAHLTTGRSTASEGGEIFATGMQQVGEGLDFSDVEMGNAAGAFMALPFDSSIAPFNAGCDQLSMGLDIDSLNFLWSLPDVG